MKVVGTLNLPDGVKNPPAILLLHGFTGRRDEMVVPAVKQGIYARAAEAWAAKGIASLRIDYCFNGGSDDDFADSTITAHVADGLAALDWLAKSGRVDPKRLALVGWSMGGALWAPGVNMAASVTLPFGKHVVNAGLAAGDKTVEGTLPWGTKVRLKSGFFKSLFQVDPVADIVEYDGPLFVAVGTNDTTVHPQPQSGQILLDYHEDGEEEFFVRPMDHAFNAMQSVAQVDELIAATGSFIAGHFDD